MAGGFGTPGTPRRDEKRERGEDQGRPRIGVVTMNVWEEGVVLEQTPTELHLR